MYEWFYNLRRSEDTALETNMHTYCHSEFKRLNGDRLRKLHAVSEPFSVLPFFFSVVGFLTPYMKIIKK